MAGEVAAQAEERKCSKYSCLLVTHDFVPVAIETTGVMGPQTSLFLKELGRRVRGQTGGPTCFLSHLSAPVNRDSERKLYLHRGRSEGHGMSRHFFRHFFD